LPELLRFACHPLWLNLGAGVEDIPARLVAKDITPDQECIGVLGQSQQAAPLGALVVENLHRVATTDKEQDCKQCETRREPRPSVRPSPALTSTGKLRSYTMKKSIILAIAIIASITAPTMANDLAAPPEIVALLKKRFSTIVGEDNVWMDVGGGHKCGNSCSLIWFETIEANWTCNFTFSVIPGAQYPKISVTSFKLLNCWKRHA
jgi:hypothetical protein